MDLIPKAIQEDFELTFEPYVLDFKQASGTSRGILTQKLGWILKLRSFSNPSIIGIGECSVIPGLSPDFSTVGAYETKLEEICKSPLTFLTTSEFLDNFPSIRFGLESAYIDWKNGGKQVYFESDFSRGKSAIPINGLIWMGSKEFMHEQIQSKILDGYSCIKMKIGAIDFDTEIELLTGIRNTFSKEEMVIRVDANGAFSPEDAPHKLKILADLNVHSIEQPLKAGQIEATSALCAKRILPIALDEELIGINKLNEKKELLVAIQPDYIILKPSLHGGISGCIEWIDLANTLDIPWWITSALESNIGLKTIAQFTATYLPTIPQGLGTGALYTTNFESNLTIINGELWQK